jgi:plastocyanin
MKMNAGTKSGTLALAAAVLVAGLSGCGSSGTTAGSGTTTSQTSSSAPATPPDRSTSPSTAPGASAPRDASKPVQPLIAIRDFSFAAPGPVAPGATVKVQNADGETHTVTSVKPGAFNVTVSGGGRTTLRAPTKAGSYAFVCNFHANMKGTLVVK